MRNWTFKDIQGWAFRFRKQSYRMMTLTKVLLFKGSLASHGIDVKWDLLVIREIRQKGIELKKKKKSISTYHNLQREPKLYISEQHERS